MIQSLGGDQIVLQDDAFNAIHARTETHPSASLR